VVIGSATIDQAYSQLVTRIGSDSQEAQRSLDTSSLLASTLQSKRDSVSGVSLDEEMTNMVRFQRGYQASARALSAMDDMLDTLITRTGRVGL
jgi:flagellar hook-associated protein 1 FlgK